MSAVWEDANTSAKQYRRALAIYLNTLLSYPYGIIMYLAINLPGCVNNVIDGLNATDKPYLKKEMEPIGKLLSDDNTTIGIIRNA